jgi:superfamily II helicase
VAITDKIYLKNHRQIVSQLDTSIPKGAFKGATMEVLYSGDGLSDPDDLYTGYPERQFVRYLLELRGQGLGPDAIVDVMSDEYMLYAYPGDVLSFLDRAVRRLEAVESLAAVEGDGAMERRAREARRTLSA